MLGKLDFLLHASILQYAGQKTFWREKWICSLLNDLLETNVSLKDIISWLDGLVKKDPCCTKSLYWNQNRTPLHNCSNQYLQNTANYRVEYTEPKRLEEMKEKRNKAMDVYCYILLANNPRLFMSFVYPFLKFAGPLSPLQRMNWLFLAFQ